MSEEEDLSKKKKEEPIVVETRENGYAMISRARKQRGADKALLETWDHDLDRESGDNNPNSRPSRG